MPAPWTVLFLCTGNSARSILAEALVNRLGEGRFRAVSAGSMPKGQVNPHALALVRELGFGDADFRSKPWDEFAVPGAPRLDFIITVCDNAAGEACPIWPGRPVTAHWGIPDPAAATGTEVEIADAFRRAARRLRHRIERLLALPAATLDGPSIRARLREIGEDADDRAA